MCVSQENDQNSWPWNLIWIKAENPHPGSGEQINGDKNQCSFGIEV